MNELTERIVSRVMAFEGSDYDQRSALGMARTWVEKGVKPEWNPNQVENKRRDDLAKEVVALMEEVSAGKDDQLGALVAARAAVNAPFRQNNPMGTAGQKPKDMKKGKSE